MTHISYYVFIQYMIREIFSYISRYSESNIYIYKVVKLLRNKIKIYCYEIIIRNGSLQVLLQSLVLFSFIL